ncbi:hypothetical protein V3W47_17860 [Deinococcus sp. YIM 134068]|uniref:hypothetical protein n=1 Tax=Deinococcus lichenicola TaxID=3118910 RepID=UPI002F925BB6
MLRARRLLFLLAVLIFLVPVGLIGAYIWQAGLDLQSPASSRQWIKVCARSREDLYCKAAARVMRETSGPVVFLHPNMGDREIVAELVRWKGRTPTAMELDAVARANLFPVPRLTEGVVTSLDGQEREVVCGLPGERLACRIDHLRFGPANLPHSPEDGAVYSTFSPQRSQHFFLPLPDR